MARATQEITVDAPVTAVYNQWTQFEDFPRFMDAVQEVEQISDRTLRWKAVIGGRYLEWDADILEQIPDEKIVWRAVDGATNAGLVSFRSAERGRTEIHLEMSYEPDGFVESIGDTLGFVERQVKQDLESFKEFIEQRDGLPTGAWRGEIENPKVPGGHTRGEGSRET